MPRLFTGIEIPDEQREDIARLRMPLPGGSKWVEPDNLHLTLRFAGDISNAQAAELTDRLAGISADAFELRLAGLGTFGGNEPRSLWVGVDPSPELEALARANERAARACGLAPEARAF
jgi:2'-5' RNA ligase